MLLSAYHSARRESNPRSGPYKRPALTVELRAASGAGGTRTRAPTRSGGRLPLNRRKRCRYATTPCGAGVCVSTDVVPTSLVLQGQVVRGGVEPGTAAQRWSAGDLSGHHAPVTTPDRVQVGMVGVEPTRSCSQGTRVAVTLHPDGFSKSERPDSNRDHRCAKVPIPLLLDPDQAPVAALLRSVVQVARRGVEPRPPA